MRRLGFCHLAAWLLLAGAGTVSAQENPKDVIQRAIKAHGGADKLSKYNAVRTRTRGSVDFNGVYVAFTSEAVAQLPGQMKNSLELTIHGQRVTARQVLNGDKAWLSALGETQELPAEVVAEMKESLYAAAVQSLTPLLNEQGYTLALLGPAKVRGREAVGVKVSSAGHKDINLYFDRQTNLLVMSARRSLDSNRSEVFLETIFSDFRETEGLQVARTVVLYHDGKRCLEGTVTDIRFAEKFDDTEFAKP
jgi:hypothetical protein